MYKILSTIILTTLLILSSTITGSAAWQLTLDVSTSDPNSDTGTASNKLTIGTEQSATDTYDNAFDTVALLKGPIQAYLVHPEYAAEQQKLWRDLRSDALPKEWTIEVNSPVEGNTINIKWGLNAPDNLNFTLIDQDSNQEVGMRASSEYSYNSTPNSQKKFLLRVSENATVSTSGGGNGISGNNSSGTGTKGGGCGYIKNVVGDGEYPGASGSAALNMVILFTPLIWLTIRRVVFSGVIVYVIKGRKEIYRRHYGEKYYPCFNLPVSFSTGDFDTK
ncbi:MAG: hypothetical protein HZA08_08865 [Nitrospirae bacterium]|nr:hypothetical protein [Nitrospirota bacterium]